MSNVTVITPPPRTETLGEFLTRHGWHSLYVSTDPVMEFGFEDPVYRVHTIELSGTWPTESISALVNACDSYTEVVPGSVTITLAEQVIPID